MSSPFAIDALTNDDTLFMLAAAMQAPGTEGKLLGLPVLLWGAPGVGKTSRFGKLAAALGFGYVEGGKPRQGAITVLGSVRRGEDFLGIPVPGVYMTPDGRTIPSDLAVKMIVEGKGEGLRPVLTYAIPEWAVQAALWAKGKPSDDDKKMAVVFFDEFTTSPLDVQAAMLRVIHERVVGDFALPANVAMVAAANPPAMAPGGQTLSTPVANRFIHLYWSPPTPKQWADWLSKTEATSTASAERRSWPKLNLRKFYAYFDQLKVYVASWVSTQGRWESGEVEAREGGGTMSSDPYGFLFRMPTEEFVANVRAFFDENPSLTEGTPADLGKPARFTDQFAWPSPRSLEIATRARAAVMALEPPADIDEISWASRRFALANAITCATIGSEACESLNTYIVTVEQESVPPADFLASPMDRARFFGRSPSDERLRVQLEKVVVYHRDLPMAEQMAKRDSIVAAIEAFRPSTISVPSVKAVAYGLRNWMVSEEGGKRSAAAAGAQRATAEALQTNVLKALAALLKAKDAEAAAAGSV